MNGLDFILAAVIILTAVFMMYYRYRASGEAFDSKRFTFCLLLVLAVATLSTGTSRGDNVTVTVSGLFGEIVKSAAAGLGVVYFYSIITGRK